MASRQESEEQLAAIRDARERRLYQLRLKHAREGNDTPPEVLNEIEDIEYKLAEVSVAEKVVNGGAMSSEVLRILRELSPNEALIKFQMMQQLAIDDMQRRIGEMREEQGESKAQRTELAKGVQALRLDLRIAAIGLLLLILAVGVSTWVMMFSIAQRGT